MNVWDFLDRVSERRARVAAERPINTRLLANVIGGALISGFIGALFALFVVPIPKGNEQIVTYMIGQLSGFAGGIVAYHYTLTAGARELDAARTANTAKAFDAIKAAAESTPNTSEMASGKFNDPVHTVEETKS